MKRYYFEPGAVQCFRRRSVLRRLPGGCKAVLKRVAQNCSSDSISKLILQAAMAVALGACLGMVAGYVDFVLAMGVTG